MLALLFCSSLSHCAASVSILHAHLYLRHLCESDVCATKTLINLNFSRSIICHQLKYLASLKIKGKKEKVSQPNKINQLAATIKVTRLTETSGVQAKTNFRTTTPRVTSFRELFLRKIIPGIFGSSDNNNPLLDPLHSFALVGTPSFEGINIRHFSIYCHSDDVHWNV